MEFRERCAACGLEFSRFNVGDGAAAFLIFLLGAVAVIGALVLELSFHPPYWVHVVLWPPLLLALTILGLRAGKGILLALEYRLDARQDVG